jgi:hypothetical protein
VAPCQKRPPEGGLFIWTRVGANFLLHKPAFCIRHIKRLVEKIIHYPQK